MGATEIEAFLTHLAVDRRVAASTQNQALNAIVFLFAAAQLSRDPVSGRRGRWHIHESTVQKAITSAARVAGITRRVTSHALRHSFATHLLVS